MSDLLDGSTADYLLSGMKSIQPAVCFRIIVTRCCLIARVRQQDKARRRCLKKTLISCSLKAFSLYIPIEFCPLVFSGIHMPVMPLDTSSNTWLICFSYKMEGELKYFKKEFTGTIREALFHEIQLRGLTKDGTDITSKEP